MTRENAVELFGEEQVVRAWRYHRPLYAAAATQLALQLVVLGLIVFGPVGDWLFERVEGWSWWAQVVGFTVLIDAVTTVVALPISVWTSFVRERRWGFSTQDLAGFAADRAKAFALGVVLLAAAFVGLVGTARAFPRIWPLVAAAGGATLVLALGFLAPLVVEPLFNRFRPLDDSRLAAELLALADRAQIPIKEVLVADASRRTRKANAYVSGLGRTRRLVLYDTLLAQATPDEVGLVLAHELGHRRAHHLVKGTLLGMIGIAGFVLLLWALLRWPELRTQIGAPGGARDPRVVAFVLLLAATLELVGMPIGAALSRSWEREADRFSLDLTNDLAVFEATHRSLATSNLADLDPPRPIYLAFFSHPTPVERIEEARRRLTDSRRAPPPTDRGMEPAPP
jgi:STE24 endopeptidase